MCMQAVLLPHTHPQCHTHHSSKQPARPHLYMPEGEKMRKNSRQCLSVCLRTALQPLLAVLPVPQLPRCVPPVPGCVPPVLLSAHNAVVFAACPADSDNAVVVYPACPAATRVYSGWSSSWHTVVHSPLKGTQSSGPRTTGGTTKTVIAPQTGTAQGTGCGTPTWAGCLTRA